MNQKNSTKQTNNTSSKSGDSTPEPRSNKLNEILHDVVVRPPTKEVNEDLSRMLANPEATQDQKDHAVSMFLYERGMHSASFIADLMMSKGAHTKETRAFKSEIRFDFELFMDMFCTYLEGQSRIVGAIYGIDVAQERADFIAFAKERNNRGTTYYDYLNYKNPENRTDTAAIIMLAMHAMDEAELVRKRIENVAKARMREKGHGIYVSAAGKPYSFNDPEVDDIIKADRARAAEIEKEDI